MNPDMQWDVECVGETDYHGVCYTHDWRSNARVDIVGAWYELIAHWQEHHRE